MILKKGKRAQFYILAAVIIIAIIVSMASIINYVAVKEKPKKFYDLSSNLNLEGSKLITYGLYNKRADIDNIIQNLTVIFSDYIAQSSEETNLVIISGDIHNITVRIINSTSTGDIKVTLGSSTSLVYRGTTNDIIVYSSRDLSEDPYISITLSNGVTQNYNLTAGENFIFVLTKNEGFEQYVRSNQDPSSPIPSNPSIITPDSPPLPEEGG